MSDRALASTGSISPLCAPLLSSSSARPNVPRSSNNAACTLLQDAHTEANHAVWGAQDEARQSESNGCVLICNQPLSLCAKVCDRLFDCIEGITWLRHGGSEWAEESAAESAICPSERRSGGVVCVAVAGAIRRCRCAVAEAGWLAGSRHQPTERAHTCERVSSDIGPVAVGLRSLQPPLASNPAPSPSHASALIIPFAGVCVCIRSQR